MKSVFVSLAAGVLIALLGVVNPVYGQNCETYTYYLSDIPLDTTPQGLKPTDIYGVSLNGSNAELTLLYTVDQAAHIAFDQSNQTLYLFTPLANGNTGVIPFDVTTNTAGATVDLGNNYAVVQAVVAADGTIYIGAHDDNVVYSVDLAGPTVTAVAVTNISGGDIIETANGELLSFTRSGNQLRNVDVVNGNSTQVAVKGYINDVTGAALMTSGDILVTQTGTSTLKVVDASGNETGNNYTATLGGSPFTLRNGDLSAGCTAFQQPCADLKLFYADQTRPNGTDWVSEVYSLSLNGTDADLTLLEDNIDGAIHLALHPTTGLLYLLNSTDGGIQTYDYTNDVLGTPFLTGITGFTAATFRADGIMIAGNAQTDLIYEIDVDAETATPLVSAPVQGGDLEYVNGKLLMFTNATQEIYEIDLVGGAHTLLGTAGGAGLATGLASLGNGTTLLSPEGTNQFSLLNDAGEAIGALDAKLNGSPFTKGFGDMAGGCVQAPPLDSTPTNPCANLKLYFSDNSDGTSSDLYRIELTGSDANITQIGSHTDPVHIAVHPNTGVVYAVSAANGDVLAFNSGTGSFNLEFNSGLASVTAVTFNAAGKLIVGEADNDKLYEIDLNTQTATFLVNAPVAGADLEFFGNELYLATRDNDRLLKIDLVGGNHTLVSSIPALTAGMALLGNGNALIMPSDQSVLIEIDNNGTQVASYDVKLSGASFTFGTGDLGSGCVDDQPNPIVVCDEYSYFLADHTNEPNINDRSTNIYGVAPSGGVAALTFLKNVPFRAQLAFNPVDKLLYLVDSDNAPHDVYSYDIANDVLTPLSAVSGSGTVSMAAFSPAGELFIGNSSEDKVYKIDPATGTKTFHADLPIQAGDLIFTKTGNLFSVSRQGDKLYAVSGGTYSVVASIEDSCTGGALTGDGKILTLHNDKTYLNNYALDGTHLGTLDLTLNGNPFTPNSGDLSSGCISAQPNIPMDPPCDDLAIYYTHVEDLPGGGHTTDLYEVSLNGSDADLTLVDSYTAGSGKGHLALDPTTGLVYIVDNLNGDITEYDPTTNTYGAVINTGLPKTPTAVFDDAGTLYVGDADLDKVYTVDLGTGTPTFVTNAPVLGGDLAFVDGDLYLATRETNQLLKLDLGGGAPTLVGSVDNLVAGMASLGNGTLLVQADGQTAYKVLDTDGNELGSLDAKLGGASFTLAGGDLASGCVAPTQPDPICDNLTLYYADNGDGTGGSTIYSVELDGTDANLTLETTVATPQHLALHPSNGLLYLVEAATGDVRTYNPTSNLVGLPFATNTGAGTVLAAFQNDSILLIGNGTNGKIYAVNILTETTTFLRNAPLAGGDFDYVDGELLTLTRNGNRLVSIDLSGSGVTDITTVDTDPFGFASLGNGTALIGSMNTTYFSVTNAAGADLGQYDVKLNGTPFNMQNGDLASGCVDLPNPGVGCENYTYYLADNNADGVRGSDIYGVRLVGNQARLTFLKHFDEPAHLAFSEAEKLLYVVFNTSPTTITTLDPVTLAEGTTKSFSGLANVPQAVVDYDGVLKVGSESADKLYAVDYAAGTFTEIGTAPISGGDLVATGSGLMLASNQGGINLYDVTSGTSTALSTPNGALATGMSLVPGGNILFSLQSSNQLWETDATGAATGQSYTLKFEGSTFTTASGGDLTGGCFEGVLVYAGDCTNNPRARKIKVTNYTGSAITNLTARATDPNNPNKYQERNRGNLNPGATWQFQYNQWKFGDTVVISENGNVLQVFVSGDANVCGAALPPVITESCSRRHNKFRWEIENPNTFRLIVWFQDTKNNGDAVSRQVGINPGTTKFVYTNETSIDFNYEGLAGTETISLSTADTIPTMCPVDQQLQIVSICSDKNKAYKWRVTNPNDYNVQILVIRDFTDKERWINIPASSKGGTKEFYTSIRNLGETVTFSYDFDQSTIDLMATANPAACDQPVEPACPGNPDVVRYAISTWENDGCKNESSHSFWFPGLFNGNTTIMHLLDNEDYTSYFDVDYYNNTAQLRGYVEVANGPGAISDGVDPYDFGGTVWRVEIDFVGGTHNPKFENEACGNQSGQLANWRYFTLVPAASGSFHFTRVTDNAGEAGSYGEDYINLTHMYDGANNFGFQMGTAANGKNKNYGISGWVFYTSNIDPSGAAEPSLPEFLGDGVGDLNADLQVICVGPEYVLSACERPTDGSCFATNVVSYTEGTKLDGSPLAFARTDAFKALGQPEDNDTYNFVTLGYGGELVLEFGGAISNGPGNDLRIVETSFGNQTPQTYNEVAQVWVSQCGLEWYSIGSVALDGELDLDDAGDDGLEWAQYIKIFNDGSTTFDGYDVDGVVALNNGCSDILDIEPVCIAFANPFVNDINIDLGDGNQFNTVEWYLYEGPMVINSGTFNNVNETFTIAGIGPTLFPAPWNPAGLYMLKIRVDGEWLKSIQLQKNF